MRQASLKIKSYASNVLVFDNLNIQRQILHISLWVFGVLSLFYVLFLGNMVFNIIERKALETEAHSLSNEIMALELNYLSLSKKIDLNFAYSLGFKEIKTKYANRKALGSINISKNEI